MKSVTWLDETEERAWRGFRRMMTLLLPRIGRDLQVDSGLSDADYEVLSNLSESIHHDYRFKDLAERMLWSKSRLSHHLTRMEGRGLIRRTEDGGDGRGSMVVLTDRGYQAITEAAPAHVASVRRHFIDLLTVEQLAIVAEVTDVVVAHLETERAK